MGDTIDTWVGRQPASDIDRRTRLRAVSAATVGNCLEYYDVHRVPLERRGRLRASTQSR